MDADIVIEPKTKQVNSTPSEMQLNKGAGALSAMIGGMSSKQRRIVAKEVYLAMIGVPRPGERS